MKSNQFLVYFNQVKYTLSWDFIFFSGSFPLFFVYQSKEEKIFSSDFICLKTVWPNANFQAAVNHNLVNKCHKCRLGPSPNLRLIIFIWSSFVIKNLTLASRQKLAMTFTVCQLWNHGLDKIFFQYKGMKSNYMKKRNIYFFFLQAKLPSQFDFLDPIIKSSNCITLREVLVWKDHKDSRCIASSTCSMDTCLCNSKSLI